MSNLIVLNHYLDGEKMPPQWERLTYSERISVCVYLRMKVNSTTLSDFRQGRKIWLDINPRDRVHIKRHLRAIGELEPREVPYTTFREYGKSVAAEMVAEAYSKDHPQITKVWFDEASRVAQLAMLYERPNGGQRTLPSVYGRLRGNEWMRANRAMQLIDEMNDGHLENTLKLLMESHGNIQAKTTTLLGKMWHHYQNQPEIQRRLEELCLLMQKVEVHEMYPIFGTLAQEQASRRPKTSVAFEAFEWGFDDAVRNW